MSADSPVLTGGENPLAPEIADPLPLPAPAIAHPRLVYLGRLAVLMAGLCAFALGEACTFKAHLGVGPWDCFHQGLSFHIPITVGQATIVVGAAVILLALTLGVRPGVGTICNMIFIGVFFDIWNGLLPDVSGAGWPWQVALDVAGVLIIGIGSGIYIKPRLGAGPRDSLMLALTRRTGWRVALVRTGVELSALCIGFLLGGTVGIGTLIFGFGIGPAVELGFRLLRVTVHTAETSG